MFYVFNSNHVCICTGTSLPNKADLSTRGEYYIESSDNCDVGYVNNGGAFSPPRVKITPESVLAKRSGLLSYFDTKLYRNQFYWNTLTVDQQNERLAFRQALLDITTQQGYPLSVIWPEYPIQ